MSIIEQKLINAYVVLLLGEKRTLEDVPKNLRQEVKIRKAEREIETLTKKDTL